MLPNSVYPAAAGAMLLLFLMFVRSGHFFRALLFSAFTGNLALLSVGYLGAFTGVALAPNLFTMGIATLLGIPGVLAMVLLRLFFLL